MLQEEEEETASQEWGRGAFLRGREGAKREMAH